MDSEVSVPGLGLYVRIQTKNLLQKKQKLLCELILKEKKPCLIVKVS